MTCDIDKRDCEYYDNGKCGWGDAKKPKTVAVDLDGTILEYDGWKGHNHFGRPIDGVRAALTELKRMGFVIIIWTNRFNREKIEEVLRKEGIPFDYINENPYQPPDISNKIYADFYIDDRAVEFRGDWKEVLVKIKRELEGAPFRVVNSSLSSIREELWLVCNRCGSKIRHSLKQGRVVRCCCGNRGEVRFSVEIV